MEESVASLGERWKKQLGSRGMTVDMQWMWLQINRRDQHPLFLREVSWAWFFQLWHGKPHGILLQILVDTLSICNMSSAFAWWQHLHQLYQQTSRWYQHTRFVQLSTIQFGAFLHYRYHQIRGSHHVAVCGRDVIGSLSIFLTWSATALYSAYKALKLRHIQTPEGVSLRDIALYYHPENIHSAQSNYIITRGQFPLLDPVEHAEVRERHRIQETIRQESVRGHWVSPWKQLPLPLLLQSASASSSMCVAN
jgi:hypothetical protein